MAGYNYTKRSVCSLHDWLHLQRSVHALCMTGYNYTKITLKEVFTLFMVTITLVLNYTKRSVHSLHGSGYNYTKRSVHPLHDWLQLH